MNVARCSPVVFVWMEWLARKCAGTTTAGSGLVLHQWDSSRTYLLIYLFTVITAWKQQSRQPGWTNCCTVHVIVASSTSGSPPDWNRLNAVFFNTAQWDNPALASSPAASGTKRTCPPWTSSNPSYSGTGRTRPPWTTSNHAGTGTKRTWPTLHPSQRDWTLPLRPGTAERVLGSSLTWAHGLGCIL